MSIVAWPQRGDIDKSEDTRREKPVQDFLETAGGDPFGSGRGRALAPQPVQRNEFDRLIGGSSGDQTDAGSIVAWPDRSEIPKPRETPKQASDPLTRFFSPEGRAAAMAANNPLAVAARSTPATATPPGSSAAFMPEGSGAPMTVNNLYSGPTPGSRGPFGNLVWSRSGLLVQPEVYFQQTGQWPVGYNSVTRSFPSPGLSQGAVPPWGTPAQDVLSQAFSPEGRAAAMAANNPLAVAARPSQAALAQFFSPEGRAAAMAANNPLAVAARTGTGARTQPATNSIQDDLISRLFGR